ncbi:uncharacterized protein BJ212DRAFT_1304346 [Suillus subaureus]|uniref:Uncharacterized protein n=1 Tax=Suillus subaureus TaxID=48587 RepID=A0A9P7DVU1_9AGAM|nr:uncharacterized protein BJ212DRAFT_1304346 [Suillus subaureus]KAG1804326.1 hypothetical protein BJ212DRAFT_1304346 [Suillus subaureus]
MKGSGFRQKKRQEQTKYEDYSGTAIREVRHIQLGVQVRGHAVTHLLINDVVLNDDLKAGVINGFKDAACSMTFGHDSILCLSSLVSELYKLKWFESVHDMKDVAYVSGYSRSESRFIQGYKTLLNFKRRPASRDTFLKDKIITLYPRKMTHAGGRPLASLINENFDIAVKTAQDLEAFFAWAPPRLSTDSEPRDAGGVFAGLESISPDDVAAEFTALKELRRTDGLFVVWRTVFNLKILGPICSVEENYCRSQELLNSPVTARLSECCRRRRHYSTQLDESIP